MVMKRNLKELFMHSQDKGFDWFTQQIRSDEKDRSMEASACLKHYIEAKCGEGQ